MLVLTRKIGQAIKIGDDIEITILGFNDYYKTLQVRVGIDAPKEINIVRTEIIKPEKKLDE